MHTLTYKLTNLVAKVQALPQDRQQHAVSALAEIVEDFYDCDTSFPGDEFA